MAEWAKFAHSAASSRWLASPPAAPSPTCDAVRVAQYVGGDKHARFDDREREPKRQHDEDESRQAKAHAPMSAKAAIDKHQGYLQSGGLLGLRRLAQ